MVGNLLDAHPRILQQGLRFENHRLVDPPGRRLPAHLLHHRRKVFRRDVHLPRVETHVPFPLVILLQKRHELVEQHLAAPLFHLTGLLPLVDLRDDIEGCREKRPDDFVTVALLVAAKHRLDQLEQLPDLIHVLRPDLQHRSLAETHVDRQRRRQVDLDLIDERFRKRQQVGRGIRRALHRPDDRVRIEKHDRIGTHRIVLHVDRHHRLARHHDDRRKAVDRRRIVGRRILVGRKRRDNQVVRKVKDIAHLLLDPGDGDLMQPFPSASCHFAGFRHSASFFDKNNIYPAKSQTTIQKSTSFAMRKRCQAEIAPSGRQKQGQSASRNGHITRSPPATHSICSGNSAPG